MKKRILSVIILSFTMFLSCKNDDNTTKAVQLPKSIKGVDANITFQYNTKNQLVKVSDKSDPTDYSETLFTYNNDGKLEKFVNASYYNGNVSTASYSVTYLANNQLRVTSDDNEYVLVSLNDKGQALSFNSIDGTTNFSYDSKGNMVQATDNSQTITATYNNDNGILSSVATPSWVLMLTDLDLHYFALNNPLTITEVYKNNGSSETYSQTMNYPKEHVIHGYPTKMIVNTTDGGESYNQTLTVTY